MKILCWLQEIQPFKGSVTSPTGPLSLRMPSLCIGLARRPTNEWQKSRREQATQRPSRPQIQPNEERMRSTHPRKRQTSCYAWYHSRNKASPCLTKLCSDHEIINTKINNFASFECFTKFLCLENLELHGTSCLAHGIVIFLKDSWSNTSDEGSIMFLPLLGDLKAVSHSHTTPQTVTAVNMISA